MTDIRLRIIPALLLCTLLSCAGKNTQESNDTLVNNDNTENTSTDEYLHIGGLRYGYKLSELDKIDSFSLRLHPYAKGFSNSLEGIELLENLNKLYILGVNRQVIESDSWQDMSGMDLFPLKSLKSLSELEISYAMFNEIPDFSEIQTLERLRFDKCKIMSLHGIDKASQIKQLDINFENYYFGDFRPLSALINLEVLSISGSNYANEEYEKTIFRVADLYGLEGLERLEIGHFGTVDLNGIQNLKNLDFLSVYKGVRIENIQEIAWLRNLQRLHIPVSVTSLDFLVPLTKLTNLILYGSGNTVDITPLKTLVNLQELGLFQFTITNLQVLNDLPKLEIVYTHDSKFYPEDNNRLEYAWVQYEPEPK